MNFDNLTTWQLANMADCASPDMPDHYGFEPRTTVTYHPSPSPGAEFLRRIARDIEEGIELRDAGIPGRILIFGALSVSDPEGLFTHDLTPTISSPGAARALAAAAAIVIDDQVMSDPI